MAKNYRRRELWLTAVLVLLPFTAPIADLDLDTRHQQAIAQARAGEFDPALQTLGALREQAPERLEFLYDQAVVFTWAERPAQALALLDDLDLKQAPAYFLEATAKAARDQGRYPLAVTLYGELAARQPEHRQALLGLALTLTDSEQYTAAEERFTDLLQRYPSDAAVLNGYGYWHQRQGNFINAAKFYGRVLAQDPDNSEANNGLDQALLELELIAKAARDRRQFDQAQQLYRQILALGPDRRQAGLGLALTLTDAGPASAKAARAQFERLLRRWPKAIDVLLGFAYYWGERRDFVRQAHSYGRVLEIDPNHREALRGQVLATAALGAPHLALSLAEQHTALFSVAELKRLRSDRAAIQIRWSRLSEPNDQPLAGTDRALLALDRASVDTANWTQRDWSRADSADLRLAFDRLVALFNRYRMRETVALYQRLRQAKVTIPDYALSTVAGAYQYLRQPASALALYRALHQRDPDNFELGLSLFYAHIEMEQFDQAYALIDRLVERQPAWRRGADGQLLVENPNRLTADVTALLARAFGDDLAYAQRGLDALIELAPANTELHSERATIYRWRGWPRLALENYDWILAGEPRFTGSRIGRAHARLDIGDFAGAAADIEVLTQREPHNLQIQTLARRQALRQYRELDISGHYGETGATAVNALGSRERQSNARLYSAPWRQRYRFFIHDYYSQAEFTQGAGNDHRLGAGVEYTGIGAGISGELAQGLLDTGKPNLSLSGYWQADDRWRLDGGFESNSVDIPLRALRIGITGRRFSTGISYRWHESQRLSLNLNWLDFSDGNRRRSVFTELNRRLINQPHFKLNGSVSLYGSDNSRSNAPYFNPRRDFSWGLKLEGDWLNFRRYEKSFRQRFDLALGEYWQEDFASDTTWRIGYGHEWTLSDTLSFDYRIERGRRVFDGEPELDTRVSAGLRLRF